MSGSINKFVVNGSSLQTRLNRPFSRLINLTCLLVVLGTTVFQCPANATSPDAVQYITNCSGGISGPNKVFVNNTGRDLLIKPWFDVPGVLAVYVKPDGEYKYAVAQKRTHAFAFCGMKSMNWARQDLKVNFGACSLANQPWSSTFCGIQSKVQLRRYTSNAPYSCPRSEFASAVEKLPDSVTRLPHGWGIRFFYFREWILNKDVVGAGGASYRCAPEPKPRGTCEDGKDNNKNGVTDFIDTSKNLNVNPNMTQPELGSSAFRIFTNMPGAIVNGYVERQNLSKRYGLPAGIDAQVIEVDKNRHIYEFPYTLSNSDMQKTGGKLGLRIRASYRPEAPCNGPQSFDVYHVNTRGTKNLVRQINLQKSGALNFINFDFGLYSPESGKGSIQIQEQTSCRTSNFSGGALISQIWVSPRDPSCDSPANNEVVKKECSDEIDNDGDGKIDFPKDPGCSSASDDDEKDPVVRDCSDNKDNDGDGDIDWPADPGCSGPNDDSENSEKECNDGRDNDHDGKIDYPKDPGCTSSTDDSEDDGGQQNPQCSDGIDNDGDGDIDWPADPGCSGPNDDSENSEKECNDGRDNDHDGKIDYPKDPGCTSSTDDSEDDGGQQNPQCSDGIDNDGDGRIDYNLNVNKHDPGCESPSDDDETDDGSCLDSLDNEGDGWFDMQDPKDCGPKGQYPTSRGSELPVGGKLEPRIECREVNTDGTTTYHMSYANFTGSVQNINVGEYKKNNLTNRYTCNGTVLSPAGAIDTFVQGVQTGKFSVVIDSNQKVEWLLGVNNQDIDGVTLDNSVPKCAATEAILVKCKNGQATFGISNSKYFDPTYVTGQTSPFYEADLV